MLFRLAEPIRKVRVDDQGIVAMFITLENVVAKYMASKKLSSGT